MLVHSLFNDIFYRGKWPLKFPHKETQTVPEAECFLLCMNAAQNY